MSRAVVADPRNSRRKYADTQIRHDDHPGSRRGGAWAAGSQVAAGCATVPRDEENVVIRTVAPDLGSCTRECSWLHGKARSFLLNAPAQESLAAAALGAPGSSPHDLPGRAGLNWRNDRYRCCGDDEL